MLVLTQKSARFRASLPAGILNSLADLVSSMNCYYANLIEGHDTHPVDIERAPRKEYSGDGVNETCNWSGPNRIDSLHGRRPPFFLWIDPFLDGNGRVARLMSNAILLDVLDTGAVWSLARGLARNLQEDKRHLAECDSDRCNDLDGRGTLSEGRSEEALADFTQFSTR